MILLPYIPQHLLVFGIFTVPFAGTFQAVGFAILLLQSVTLPAFPAYRCLNWKLVSGLGVLSYSVYIWQQLFCAPAATYGVAPRWWLSYPTWLLAALAAATLSYFCLERPLFNLRAHFRE